MNTFFATGSVNGCGLKACSPTSLASASNGIYVRHMVPPACSPQSKQAPATAACSRIYGARVVLDRAGGSGDGGATGNDEERRGAARRAAYREARGLTGSDGARGGQQQAALRRRRAGEGQRHAGRQRRAVRRRKQR